VDEATPERVAGWVYDPQRDGRPLAVDVEINRDRVARVKACVHREDLERLGFGDGRIGFEFGPARYLQPGDNEVRVYYAGSDEMVDGGARTVLNLDRGAAGGQHDPSDLLELSQVRWRADEDEERLTWGAPMTGDTFVDVVQRHYRFTGRDTVVEIGPGYGRLLRCLLDRKQSFARYLGLEISAARVARLAGRFPLPGVEFVQADILHEVPSARADVVICSSTFEHLFPSMARGLDNLRAASGPQTKLFIDFIQNEGDDELRTARAYFEDTTAYIRVYSLPEIERLFAAAGFRVTALEKIVLGKDEFGKDVHRALVVAERAA
jgi:SAM-dependent methyltransferase